MTYCRDHPDKSAFKQYEEQWKAWEAQVEQRRAQIRSQKGAAGAAPASAAPHNGPGPGPTSTGISTAAGVAAAMASRGQPVGAHRYPSGGQAMPGMPVGPRVPLTVQPVMPTP